MTLIVALLCPAHAGAATMFYIRGGGNGHGVGMSQYGAYGYALHGKDYRFILAHYFKGTALGSTDPRQTVRVLLATGTATFSGASRAGRKALKPNLTYQVHLLSNGALSLTDQSGKTLGHFSAPLAVSGPRPLSTDGLGLYRGSLEFRPDGGGGVQTVDALALDDYVRGVVSAEMPASWSAEALKTQAVAARTYAITTTVGGTGFDLYSDTRSQVYRGVSAETTTTDAAVAATKGQIVTYGGSPAVTYFFASSGGHTENVENVWPGATAEPWLRGVRDPYDGAGGDPYHRWGSDLTPASAQSKLGNLVRGSLIGIKVTKHGASPRILLADVVGSRGRVKATGSQLQQAFGLLTTYAAFTTITTSAGQAHPTHRAQTIAAVVRSIIAAVTPGIHGSAFPAHKGDKLTVQDRHNGGWHSVAHVKLGAGGTYSVQLAAPGSYRVVYRGIHGPAVAVP